VIRYDSIGKDYNNTRSADPFITEALYSMLSPISGGLYLDIGCGTGNYLTAFSKKGVQFIGVDPSEVMLQQAKSKNDNTVFIQAQSESIPLPDAYFDGAIAILTMHHWDDIGKGLKEIKRVLKPGAHLACFSFTPQQVMGYWLHYYFPKMIERSSQTIPEWNEMEQLILNAGFSHIKTEPYFIKKDQQDHFLYSHKTRPEQYLRQEIRNNISSFTTFSNAEELIAGLLKLESDINSGEIKEVMGKYENDLGDYLFIAAT
jgi:ubiquinone/menaquinone biosynthesis C-methylase UbiE